MTAAGVTPNGRAPNPPPGEAVAGVVLDAKYLLKSRLGRGGFGDVWRAEELLPDGTPFREVALKLLSGAPTDAVGWAEEAKLLASFHHPSLVTIYAAGILRDGTRFVAMEVLEGQNLAEVSRARGKVPWRRVLGWALDAASALDVIHARGVVHLDLKPANLFVVTGATGEGQLKVLDFGIARQAGAAPPPAPTAHVPFDAELGATAPQITTMPEAAVIHARPPEVDAVRVQRHDAALAATRLASRATDAQGRAVVGTPGFIAPEVLACRAPTPAADAYALAVCIAQLATGSLPLDVDEEPEDWHDNAVVSRWLGSVRDAALGGHLKPLLDLPPGVRALVQRLCAVSPAARGVAPGGLAALVREAVERPFGVPENPYFAPSPFPREAEGLLFGRDDDTARLGRELTYESCLVVQGARGVGKTSLLRVGVVPHLARGAVDGMDDWVLVEIAPGDDPDAALEAALVALDPLLAGAEPADLEAWSAAEGVGVALSIDPLEDATRAPLEKQHRLLALAVDITRESFSGVRVLGALSDARAAAALATPLGAALRSGVRFVGGPSPAAARAIAVRPAELAGADVEGADLVAADVERELRAGGERLPIVAVALAAWWSSRAAPSGRTSSQQGSASRPSASTTAARAAGLPTPSSPDASVTPSAPVVEHHPSGKVVIHTPDGTPATKSSPVASAKRDAAAAASGATVAASTPRGRATRSAPTGDVTSASGSLVPDAVVSRSGRSVPLSGARFREAGGVRGAFARHAEAAMRALDPAIRVVAEQLLLRLMTTEGQSRPWVEDELVDVSGEASAGAALGALESAGLVTRAGGKVELAHEALGTAWPRLADLRLQRLDRLALLERLHDAAVTWEREGERADFLLTGPQLVEAVAALRASGDLRLTSRERTFVEASARVSRRRRLFRGAGLAAAIASTVIGLFGWRKLEVARRQEEAAKNAAIEVEVAGDLAAKSRRALDPPARVAFAAEAMARGSSDGALPVEIAAAARKAAHADYLTLDTVADPTFPWDDRWLIANSASGDLVVVDFHPTGSDVYDDIDLDVDPTSRARRPRTSTLRPFDAPLAEIVPFAFDTTFAARSIDGDVKVFRLREDGGAGLVATAPMTCVGALHLARAAPVIACATERGIARWDLRDRAKYDISKAECAVQDISPDGSRVVGRVTRRVVVWSPRAPNAKNGGDAKDAEARYTAPFSVASARFSPDGKAIAVVGVRLDVLDAAAPRAPIFSTDLDLDPASVRWHEGGLDVGLCDASGRGRWTYLRRGARSPDDVAPRGDPCRASGPLSRPEALGPDEIPDELRARDSGAHLAAGGFRLAQKRVLSRDLVLFDTSATGALLGFKAKDELGEEADDDAPTGPSRVVREGGAVAVQMGDEVRVYSAVDGARLGSRSGSIVRRCADGRLLAAHAEVLGARLFDVWTGRTAGWVRDAPGSHWFGADGGCTVAFTQHLDGTLVASKLDPTDYGAVTVIGHADGFVFDARPSQAAGALGAGTWIAVSSGALARIDDGSLALRIVGHASPRATAIADGPGPGELTFADASGVAVADVTGGFRRVLQSFGDGWTDIAPHREGASMLLASEDAIGVLDVNRREIVSRIPLGAAGSFAAWDDDGSVLSYAPGKAGALEGVVVPRSRSLAKETSTRLSNLDVVAGRLGTRN